MIRRLFPAIILTLIAACAASQTAQPPTESQAEHTPVSPNHPPTPSHQAAGTTVTVQVDGSRRYQQFDGFGASIGIPEQMGLYNAHDSTIPVNLTTTDAQIQDIARILYTDLGIRRARILLENYEPEKGTFAWATEEEDREAVYIGLSGPFGLTTPWLEFSVDIGDGQAWLRRADSACALDPAKLDDEVEWIIAGVLRFRNLDQTVDYIGVNNEPDLCPPGYKIEINDYVEIVKRLGKRLQDEGLQTRIVVTDGWIPQNSILYMEAVLADEEARSYVGALAYHAYDGYDNLEVLLQQSAAGKPPEHGSAVRRQIRALTDQYGLPVWMTEVCYCVDRGLPDFELIRGRLNHLHDELSIANVNAFDVMNTFFLDRPGVRDELVHLYFDSRGALERYEAAPYGLVIGQYARAIVPGSIRLEASSSDGYTRVLAFERPDGKLVVVLLNNNEADFQAEVFLSGMTSAPANFSVEASWENTYAESQPDAAAGGGKIVLTLPARSVTVLVGK